MSDLSYLQADKSQFIPLMGCIRSVCGDLNHCALGQRIIWMSSLQLWFEQDFLLSAVKKPRAGGWDGESKYSEERKDLWVTLSYKLLIPGLNGPSEQGAEQGNVSWWDESKGHGEGTISTHQTFLW